MLIFGFKKGKQIEGNSGLSLDQARAQKQAEMDEIAKSLLEESTAKHPDLETATLTEKRQQVLAFLESQDPFDCPALTLEATAVAGILAGGEPSQAQINQELSELASSIARQAQQIEALQATVIGWRSAMSRILADLPTVAAVQNLPIQAPI